MSDGKLDKEGSFNSVVIAWHSSACDEGQVANFQYVDEPKVDYRKNYVVP